MDVRREARLLISLSVLQSPEIKKRGGFGFVKRLGSRAFAAAYRAHDKSFVTQALQGAVVICTDKHGIWQACMTSEEARRWSGRLE
jgi:hypothetical protein